MMFSIWVGSRQYILSYIMRNVMYDLANAVAPVLAVVALLSFVAGSFALSWVCALGIVVCMEARVQAGRRLPRTTLFWIHLLASLPFVACMTILAFWVSSAALTVVTGLLGLIALCSGAILWYRGLERQMLHLRAWR